MKKRLVLEVNEKSTDKTAYFNLPSGGQVMFAPVVSDEYWMFRVKVSKTQAVLGFRKFGVIGIGFAKEEDWNSNLPANCDAERIWKHIQHNADGATKKNTIEAIKMIQKAARDLDPEGFDVATARLTGRR